MPPRLHKFLLFACWLVAGASTAAEAVSIESLADPIGIYMARVSPDGSKIAALSFNGEINKLLLIDVATMTSKPLLVTTVMPTGLLESPVELMWAGDDLIVVNFDRYYDQVAESIALDGHTVAKLGSRVLKVVTPADGGAPQALSVIDGNGTMARIDARTGKQERFAFQMGGVPETVAFDKNGTPRAVTMVDSRYFDGTTKVSNWYRPSATAAWVRLADYQVGDERWRPLYAPDEENKLIVSSRAGRDTYAIFSYDTRTGQFGEMMAGHPQVDIESVNDLDLSLFERVETGGMLRQQIWLDPVWARVQQTVDAALPGRINKLSGNPARKVMVFSYSDIDPGTWYLFDVKQQSLQSVARKQQSIDPAAMRPMRIVNYRTPDGLTIPAYLTLPEKGGKNLPAVLMVHGGPIDRDEFEWDATVQLLASRGYAVLQPQFRGSTGFGRKFEAAGYGQWGLAMQDDITAGVHYLVEQGIADPKRVCIFGGSYGGYAALWGVVKDPNLYRCAVSFAGISDLTSFLQDEANNVYTMAKHELMRKHIGDPRLDAARLDAVSPLRFADRIQVPVLIMHGDADRRVLIGQSQRISERLRDMGKPRQFLAFLHEGHGLRTQENIELYLQTVIAFLDKNLGNNK